ncbi:hypothetical protein JRO89_XS03G0337700 [Xanthoceras sorbifolium]|uniref:WPP domain-interacting protein 2 n=1 Tax=Xanthoceras sorbifolium TaxID=99658 RepID=A0ABQ8IDL7_9ROSI|nr:hypothetical protein JRO89_XS03G0337700 [Xanthoceras sorbifolium]
MDLETEFSAFEYVEDNELVNRGTVKGNGSCSNEIENNKLGDGGIMDANAEADDDHVEKGVESVQQLTSPSSTIKSPPGVSSPATKGYGLKKWRRIKRDVVKDAGPSVDSSKVLKRGLSGAANPNKPLHMSPVDIRQNSEGSVGSTNVVNNVGAMDGFAVRGSSVDSRFAVGSAFAAGTDSENSEDRSSKSSTAASAPRMRYELPAVMGNARERNRTKNLSGKSGGNPTQRVQQGKTRAESSKKHRGEKVKIEKENSHSSMESDSRSSNFVFMQGAFSVNCNGKPGDRSMNYDGENSDDAHACEQQFSEEVQTGYAKDNVEEIEDLSQEDLAANSAWDPKEENHHCPSTDRDPLVESILTLQSVQEALEKEVLKFGEIGKDAVSLHENSYESSSVPADSTFTDPAIHGPSSSDQLDKMRENASSSLEMQVLNLKQNVKYLESKLEEARANIEVKESRVAELEAALNSSKPLKEDSGSNIELQPEKCREMETELEGLFCQKIEAEIEYLTLTRAIQKLRVAAGDQTTLFEEQETLAEEQTDMLNKFGEAENRAAVLKKQAEELEKYWGDISGTEVVLKMQKGVCKVTSYFMIQLILLGLVLWLCVLHFSPHPEVIPT